MPIFVPHLPLQLDRAHATSESEAISRAFQGLSSSKWKCAWRKSFVMLPPASAGLQGLTESLATRVNLPQAVTNLSLWHLQPD